MRARSKRLNRHSLLAAPIVFTATVTAACSDASQLNPQTPQEPTSVVDAPTASAAPSATVARTPPTSTPTATPTGNVVLISDGAGGSIVRQPDGTCLHVFPEPSMECPPGWSCNPGPPQDPEKVACPPAKLDKK